MNVEEANLGEHLHNSNGNSEFNFARDQEGDEDGIQRSSHTPGNCFQQASVMLVYDWERPASARPDRFRVRNRRQGFSILLDPITGRGDLDRQFFTERHGT